MATRRVNSRSDYYTDNVYVNGNTVRKSAVPVYPENEEEIIRQRKKRRQVRQHREKVRQMSRGYVIFLAIASVATMFACVRYIELRSQVTATLKEVAKLETELNQLTAENDALYNQTINNIDLEYIKDVAMNQLDMDYPTAEQIISYSDISCNSYVRQYRDVPK